MGTGTVEPAEDSLGLREFCGRLIAAIDEERRGFVVMMAEGKCEDFAHYRAACGMIEGYGHSQELIRQALARALSEDE